MEIQQLPEFKNKPEPFTLSGDESVSQAIVVMAEKISVPLLLLTQILMLKG